MTNINLFKKQVEKLYPTNITLTKNDKEFIKKNNLNLSLFVREKLKELKNEVEK